MTDTKTEHGPEEPIEAEFVEHSDASSSAPADSALPGWLTSLPDTLRPYAALARLDRPIGTWLVMLPAMAALAYTRIATGFFWIDIWWDLLIAIGAVTMRGAACTWNDITDKDFDAAVDRTANRPLPSGQVSVRNAYIFLALQVAVGFIAWLCLPTDAKVVALLALPLIVAYPFMKRVTWWPQAWLGFTINWGVLVAAAMATHVSMGTVLLYLGFAAWTVGYDTIYALQDKEDDALIGVKSSARLMGDKAVLGAFCFYLTAAAFFAAASAANSAPRLGALTVIGFLAHAVWQVYMVNRDEANALKVFKSNAWAALILLFGFTIAAIV
ncbi:4-hydroxybenzoate octaprenyltransferase [Henriciella litoralis]|uniref:4-hydroxybenzoate octaprenyltransferase n=1 Tax=Henriciella litoralis TaxID=568102 RepID=UPI0009FD8512|nr:4-hydroxybenzoate octaprenyltransferase [Henriciella litoralis]